MTICNYILVFSFLACAVVVDYCSLIQTREKMACSTGLVLLEVLNDGDMKSWFIARGVLQLSMSQRIMEK